MVDNHQSYLKNVSNDFKEWFLDKNHPHSTLNKTVFFHDLLKFAGILIVFLIVYNNIIKLNQINLWIIEIGSVVLLVLLYFLIRKLWHLFLNLKYWFKGFNNGTKTIIGIAIIILLLCAFLNQSKVVNNITNTYDSVQFSNFIPVNLEALNLSVINLNGLSKGLNTCPQINVSMDLYLYNNIFDGSIGSISGKSDDGWTVHGQATCRKGANEGENLNRYYCGGYSYIMGLGSVNAYVQKTTVSTTGDIGKTYKYVIWNIYDERKRFVETRCLGNPDDFNQKQAEAFINEMKSWG